MARTVMGESEKTPGLYSTSFLKNFKPNQSLVQGGRCRTECRQTDQSYFWCFDRWNDLESWDYCSPPGQVGDLEKTILESFSLNSWLLQCRYVLWSTRGMAKLVLGSVKRRMVNPTGGATSPAGYYHMYGDWWSLCLDKMATMLVLGF